MTTVAFNERLKYMYYNIVGQMSSLGSSMVIAYIKTWVVRLASIVTLDMYTYLRHLNAFWKQNADIMFIVHA